MIGPAPERLGSMGSGESPPYPLALWVCSIGRSSFIDRRKLWIRLQKF